MRVPEYRTYTCAIQVPQALFNPACKRILHWQGRGACSHLSSISPTCNGQQSCALTVHTLTCDTWRHAAGRRPSPSAPRQESKGVNHSITAHCGVSRSSAVQHLIHDDQPRGMLQGGGLLLQHPGRQRGGRQLRVRSGAREPERTCQHLQALHQPHHLHRPARRGLAVLRARCGRGHC